MSAIAKKSSGTVFPNSIVDEEWEYLDPTPDIFALFVQFDDRFFDGKLKSVSIKWSPRMTVCAGLCRYEGKRSGACSISLSLPLLKLRPRKDLVETLLHEMIHAFLFLTSNNRDRDGHGPEFQFHMNRINHESGTKITIYHSFHDEVKLYKTHWWKCNGACQHRPPFYGLVKRSMNRAPGPNDNWWAAHQASCNGSFIKIREPENYGVKKKKEDSAGKSSGPAKKPKMEAVPSGSRDIRGFFGNSPPSSKGQASSSSETSSWEPKKSLPAIGASSSNSNGTATKGKAIQGGYGTMKNWGSSTTLVKPTSSISEALPDEGSSQARPTQGGVVSVPSTSRTFTPFAGQGHVLGGTVRARSPPRPSHQSVVPKKGVEIIDLNDSLVFPDEDEKAPCPVCQKSLPLSQINGHLDSCLNMI